jgi:single-strand DNA-binding protein
MSELGVNKVVLLGRAGGDAELKFTSGGKPVANFSLAVNESFKTRESDKADHVEWFQCVCWNRLGEIAGQYVTRGKLVFVEGRLQTRKYDDRGGNARKVTEVVVRQLRLLGGAGAGNGNADPTKATGHGAEAGDAQAQQTHGPMDDSIPF